jgi:hypothetical protein
VAPFAYAALGIGALALVDKAHAVVIAPGENGVAPISYQARCRRMRAARDKDRVRAANNSS